MRIALAQLDATLGDVEANLGRVRDALSEAGAAGAELVVFPELFVSGYTLRETDGETVCSAEDVARLTMPGGPAGLVGFHQRSHAELGHNSAAYVADGAVVHVHRKLYLVDYAPFCEDELFEPGSELRAFDTPFGRAAAIICNDAWQPFLPFIAAQDGARVLLVPSCSSTAVPQAEEYWYELTRFHARMLQCFVVFVNRVGDEGGLTFWGGSHVIGPSGEAVVQGPRFDEAIVYAELDLEQVESHRRDLPILGDPRLDVLRSELERLALGRWGLR